MEFKEAFEVIMLITGKLYFFCVIISYMTIENASSPEMLEI